MTRKLSDWASIAEIVSGVAVVISLVFLIFGIRENTEVTRAAAFDRNLESINQVAIAIGQDEELAGLYQTYQEGRLHELTTAEWFRVRILVGALFRRYESAFYANQYGSLGSSEWTRLAAEICVHRRRLDAVWEELPFISTDEFSDFVEESCSAQ